jgi:O-glycosyl hydrolase
MEGFGSSVRVFDDPHVTETSDPRTGRSAVVITRAQEDELLDRLYRDLGFTRVRPILEGGIEVDNDNGDPRRTDLRRFNFAWKRNDAHVEYVLRARERGVSRFFVSPIRLERWMGTSSQDDVDEYVEWAMAVSRRWRELGAELPYYSVLNEPGHPSIRLTAEFMRDVIKAMGRRLRDEGFQTRFVITDDFGPVEAAANCRVILEDPDARQYVAALATHLYTGWDLTPLASLSRQFNLPIWMTEFSRGDPLQYAGIMSDLITEHDVSALDYMWGFFGEQDQAQLIRLKHNDPKRPGYDPNAGPVYRGYELSKMYYIVGQFSRFVRPGARRMETTASDPSIKVSAFRTGDGVVIVAVNEQGGTQRLVFSLNGVAGAAQIFPVRTTEAAENWAALPAIAEAGATFTSDLPPRSVTTFMTTVTGPDAPGPPSPTRPPPIKPEVDRVVPRPPDLHD